MAEPGFLEGDGQELEIAGGWVGTGTTVYITGVGTQGRIQDFGKGGVRVTVKY